MGGAFRMVIARRGVLKVAGILFVVLFLSQEAFGYWVWTPGTKKFINPKYAVKDSPKEQFDYAMGFFNAKDYKRAAAEFERLVKAYEDSEYASEAQYYVGLSFELQGKHYFAFQNYQKVVEGYPHSTRLEEVIEREFRIGDMYLNRGGSKLLGTEIMTPLDRAVEIFKKVVDNAPYGPFADKAQFKLGQAYKKSELFEEAIIAFQRLVDEYPESPLVDKARFEVASCAYKASLKPAYDSAPAEKAIAAFREFVETNRDKEVAKEADRTLQRLTDNIAEKSFSIGEFYERQRHYESAIMYYNEVVEKYPQSSFGRTAAVKITELKAKMAPKVRVKKERVKWPEKEEAKKVAPPKAAAPPPKEKMPPEKAKEAAVPAEAAKPALPEEAAEEEVLPVKDEPFPQPAAAPAVMPEEKVAGEAPAPAPAKGFFGYTTQSMLPSNLKTIYVENFVNKIAMTAETSDERMYRGYKPEMQFDITKAVIDRYIFDGNLKVVDAGKASDLILTGELVDFKREPLRYDSNDNIEEFRIRLIVNLVLKDVKTGKVVWTEKEFAGESTYDTTGSLAKSERSAIEDATFDLARRIVERTIENW